MWSSRATCPPQVNYLWAVLIVLTDASGGETPWASCCSMLWLLQTPTDSLFCLLPQAHSWILLQIFSAEFFFLNKYNHFVFLLCLQKLSIAQEHMWRYTNCLSTNAVNDIIDICIKRYECLTLVLYIYTVNLHNIKVSPWQTRCMKKIFRDN